jgi:hypothetical protein
MRFTVRFGGWLKAEGCWPVAEAEVVLARSFSCGEAPPSDGRGGRAPARLLRADALLERCAQGIKCALVKRERIFFNGASYGEGIPFGLTPLFCLAKVERLGEKLLQRFFLRSGRGRGKPA